MRYRHSLLVMGALTLLASAPAVAEEVPDALVATAPAEPALLTGGNLLGLRGLARIVSAAPHRLNQISLGMDMQFFSAGSFLNDRADGAVYDHSRLTNSYSIAWSPFRFLEGAFALHVISDSSELVSTTAGAEQKPLQVAIGDPQLVLKTGFSPIDGLALGAYLDILFHSGAGFFQTSFSATNIAFALLASYRISDAIPLSFHANIGFLIDGSENLFDAPRDLSEPQRFAAQLSSFNRVIARFGVDYETRWVAPFVELSLEPYVGSGAPGFGDGPGRVTLGVKGWLGSLRGFQLMAAVDIGITGTGPLDAAALAADKYATAIPGVNFFARLSYRFDPTFTRTKVVARSTGSDPATAKPTPVGPKLASISGTILDTRTNEPITEARVQIVGQRSSALAVAKDGSFTSHPLAVGKHRIVVIANGYEDREIEVEVKEGGSSIPANTAKLTPKISIKPGTLRGIVKSRATGRALAGVTILIPELDKTIAADRDGNFSITLKPGEYTVVFSAKRMRSQSKRVRIIEGETVIRNIDLYR